MTEHEQLADALRESRSRILSGWASRVYKDPMLWLDLPAYDSPIDGRMIEGRVARREDLKRHGCIEFDPGMKQDADRNRRNDDQKLEASIHAGIEREIARMPEQKIRQLEAEMSTGYTVNIVRR